MPEVEALADCLRLVVDEIVAPLPDEAHDGTRLAMALFVACDLGQTDPTVRSLIARVFSVPADAIPGNAIPGNAIPGEPIPGDTV